MRRRVTKIASFLTNSIDDTQLLIGQNTHWPLAVFSTKLTRPRRKNERKKGGKERRKNKKRK